MLPLTDSTPVLTVEAPSIPPLPSPAPRWRFATRVAFRFCFVYFGLYILLTQMNFIPGVPRLITPVAPIVFWVIRNVFHDERTLQVMGGSGDKMFDYVFVLCLFVFAAFVTLIWSMVDRRRTNYARLNKWFRVYLRFGLATTMLGYGMIKAIPLQMSAPS